MSDITLEEELRLGIKAHKEGNVQDANRHYSLILEAEPNHPEANHNMGILAAGVGKIEQSPSFFKRAIESRPSMIQSWCGLVEVLVKLHKIQDASNVLAQAFSVGLKSDQLDQLDRKLKKLKENLDFATYDKVRNALGLEPMRQAADKGAQITDNIRKNLGI